MSELSSNYLVRPEILGHHPEKPEIGYHELLLIIVRSLASAFENGNTLELEELNTLAGNTIVGEKNKQEKPKPSIIDSQPPSAVSPEELEEARINSSELHEQILYWYNRMVTALNKHPDLIKKRLNGVLTEIKTEEYKIYKRKIKIPKQHIESLTVYLSKDFKNFLD